jgi:hypothetical protein
MESTGPKLYPTRLTWFENVECENSLNTKPMEFEDGIAHEVLCDEAIK